MGPMLPHIPLDIIELFMDDLVGDNDKSALAACSLVCSAWLHPSRSRLFYHIRIESAKLSGYDVLLTFFRSSSSFCGYVRKLTLYRSCFVSTGPVNARILASILARLQHLHTLVLDSVEIGDNGAFPVSPPSQPSLQVQPCFRLHSLVLTGVTVQKDFRDHLWMVFSLFSTVESLKMSRMFIGGNADEVKTSIPGSLPVKVQSLKLERFLALPGNSWLLKNLRGILAIHHLQSLAFSSLAGTHLFTALGHVLRDVGPHLLHLELGLATSSMLDFSLSDRILTTTQWKDMLHLPLCTSLHSLTIHFDDDPRHADGHLKENAWQSALNCLLAIPANTIIQITLVVPMSNHSRNDYATLDSNAVQCHARVWGLRPALWERLQITILGHFGHLEGIILKITTASSVGLSARTSSPYRPKQQPSSERWPQVFEISSETPSVLAGDLS